MRRFFVAPESLGSSSVLITGELYTHISVVLRMKAGDRIKLADGTGAEAVGTIVSVGKNELNVELESFPLGHTAAVVPRITLYQGLPKSEKIDLIIQKATELGVYKIVPFMAARSIPRLAGDRLEKRVVRWERIAAEAARQSGRSGIPEIGFAECIDEVLLRKGDSLGLLIWEGEREQHLRSILKGVSEPDELSIIIGPEGGLAPEEAAAAVAAGYKPVTLGVRILRTETAGLAVRAILQYVFGDLG
jgi:16S rRNA (uracil1498-N3)-methyltransferase